MNLDAFIIENDVRKHCDAFVFPLGFLAVGMAEVRREAHKRTLPKGKTDFATTFSEIEKEMNAEGFVAALAVALGVDLQVTAPQLLNIVGGMRSSLGKLCVPPGQVDGLRDEVLTRIARMLAGMFLKTILGKMQEKDILEIAHSSKDAILRLNDMIKAYLLKIDESIVS